MEKKNLLLVCTHGKFGEEMIRSAEMIVGPMEHVCACSLLPGMSQDDYINVIQIQVKKYSESSIIVLADLFGGTPCNTTARLLKEYNMQLITGLNLGMLLEVYSMLQTSTLQQLGEIAMKALNITGVDVNKRLGISLSEEVS